MKHPTIGILRLPNLLIVAATQFLLQYLVLLPTLHAVELQATLDHLHFSLFVLVTLIITAGGYIVNDILDYDTDLINKPDKVFIQPPFTKKQAWIYYALLSMVGMGLSLYLGFHVGAPQLALIFPLAVGGLWLYSYSWKKKPFVGNGVVALYCAGVAGIVLFAEREAYQNLATQQPDFAAGIEWLFGGYVVFAFFSTLLREIVKDLEDLEGDQMAGMQTLPIAYGIAAAKKTAIAIAVLLVVILMPFLKWLWQQGESVSLIFATAAILLPLGYIVLQLLKAERKSDFSRLSFFIKLIMAAGLLLLVLIAA